MKNKTNKAPSKAAEFQFAPLLSTSYGKTEFDELQVESAGPKLQTLTADDGTTKQEFLRVSGELISEVIEKTIYEINHFLRSHHLASLAAILKDKEASRNDRFVAYELLKNANIAAGGIFPMCQDTGTAIIKAKRGSGIITQENDEKSIARGIFQAYQKHNLRMSQLAPIGLFEESNTKTNLPAEIEVNYDPEALEYKFLVIAKGGGSANKSFLYQETPQLLDEKRLLAFITEKLKTFGTAACPPYHLAIVVGGSSGEFALKTAKLASCHALDTLPTKGDGLGGAIRDPEFEKKVLELTYRLGIGAQFGGKYFCHDVRVIRLARHGASLPVAMAVSCSADRQAWAKITPRGVFVERLDHNPARWLENLEPQDLGEPVKINLNEAMPSVLKTLSRYPVKTRLSLSGTMLVARDAAHKRWREMIEAGKQLPEYCKRYPIYYAGPAKTPSGYASGSFGPTTAGRMDAYMDLLQSQGVALITLAKGNRSRLVRESCKKYGGFYLGSIGGPAALIGRDCITSVEALDFQDLGMEAVWKIELKDFPAFIVIDDKGNDFFAMLS